MEYRIRKAIITGGTGGIGLPLIRALLEDRVEVLMLRRRDTSRAMVLPEHKLLHIEYYALEELGMYVPQKAGYDVFFHLGWGKTSQEERNNIMLQKKNVQYS